MNAFNWKLILQLSLFGFAMAVATVFWISSAVEPFFWLAIFIICAVIIARTVPAKHFLHGFFVSLVNCVWITSAHIIFFHAYIANHAQEASMLASSTATLSPRMMMALTGPVIGIVSGLVLGLFAFVAGKLFKKA
jgi:hypothetical protein